MTRKHTPEPWMFDEATGDVVTKDDVLVHRSPGDYDARSDEELSADSRLIAASPEMLAELEEIIKGWRIVESQLRRLTPWEAERLDAAERVVAIAKAEGASE